MTSRQAKRWFQSKVIQAHASEKREIENILSNMIPVLYDDHNPSSDQISVYSKHTPRVTASYHGTKQVGLEPVTKYRFSMNFGYWRYDERERNIEALLHEVSHIRFEHHKKEFWLQLASNRNKLKDKGFESLNWNKVGQRIIHGARNQADGRQDVDSILEALSDVMNVPIPEVDTREKMLNNSRTVQGDVYEMGVVEPEKIDYGNSSIEERFNWLMENTSKEIHLPMVTKGNTEDTWTPVSEKDDMRCQVFEVWCPYKIPFEDADGGSSI